MQPPEPESAHKTGEGKSVLTVVARGGRPEKIVQAQHVNNRFNPLAAFYMGAAALLIFAAFYFLQQMSIAPARATGAPFLTPVPSLPVRQFTAIALSSPNIIYMYTSTPTPRPTMTFVPTNTPVPPTATLVPPTLTRTPSFTPSPTATRRPDVLLSLQAVWLPKADTLKTASGALVSSIEGWGAVCPDKWLLGTELVLLGGQRFVCLDRAALRCDGYTCRVLVFTRQKGLPSMESAYVNAPFAGGSDDKR